MVNQQTSGREAALMDLQDETGKKQRTVLKIADEHKEVGLSTRPAKREPFTAESRTSSWGDTT